MAEKPRNLFRILADVLRLEERIARPDGKAGDTWMRWFWDLVTGLNENFQSAGVDDTSTSLPGRVAALEERARQAEEAESRLLAVAAQAQQDIAVIAAAAVTAQDAPPVYVAPVADQIVDPPRIEQLAARVAVLETIGTAPPVPALLEQQIAQIAEAAVADAFAKAPTVETVAPDAPGIVNEPATVDAPGISYEPVPADPFDTADPYLELGQLFKARTYTQIVPMADTYLPTTQPASALNMYETVVAGSAFQCRECAPGTLATDNDNFLFLLSPPEGWDGQPVQVRVIWTHSATVTNFLVAWCANAQQYTDGGSGTAVFSADTVVQDVGGTTDAIYTAIPMIVTPANASAAPATPQFPVLFKVKRRNQNEGAVGLAVNARVIGVQVIWNLRPVALT